MTLRLFVCLACGAIFCLLLAASPGWAQPSDPGQLPEEPRQNISSQLSDLPVVESSGEYTYAFNFNIPEFRGLVPNLRLIYSSSNALRGGADNYVAFGWRLAGLSKIERESVGGGVPFFDDGQDIYRYDGAELIACNDVAATNKWTGKYPLRYLTTGKSASCSAGGNFSTRVESFNRITYNDATNEWTVVRPDGRHYRYEAVGVLAGDNSVSGEVYKMGHQSRWVLTEISDAQKDGSGKATNKVTIRWAVRGSGYGFAERPAEIEYQGYRVQFLYEQMAQPTADFATGTSNLGEQDKQLFAVLVYDGSIQVRAYNLVTSPSTFTGTRLLTKVQTYGAGWVINANSFIAGTRLPDVSFEYSPEAYSLVQKTYAGTKFSQSNISLDADYNGRDELFFYDGYDPNMGNLSRAAYAFSSAGGITSLGVAENLCKNATANFGSDNWIAKDDAPRWVIQNDRSEYLKCIKSRRLTTQGYANPLNRTITEIEYEIYNFERDKPLGNFGNVLNSPYDGIQRDYYPPGTAAGYTFFLGNFDLDANSEGFFFEDIYDLKGDVFARLWTPSFGSGGTFSGLSEGGYKVAGDYNGDGVDEIIEYEGDGTRPVSLHSILHETGWLGGSLKAPGTVISRSLPSGLPDGELFDGYDLFTPWYRERYPSYYQGADFNGDGIADLAAYIADTVGPDRVVVSLSTGAMTGSAFLPPISIDLPTNYYKGAGYFKDINGDGYSDIIIQGSKLYNGYDGDWAPKADVYLNRGLIKTSGGGFNNPWRFNVLHFADVQRFNGMGDFNGDGLTDFVTHNAPGAIFFGDGGIPNRLVAVDDARGGRTEVAYLSSAQQPGQTGPNQIPVVQQLVEAITVKDGRGGSRTTHYTYANGKYDFINRKALGYDTVTATLEALPGEAAAPVVTTIYLNNNFVDAALVKSRIVSTGGTVTWAKEVNDWEVSLGGVAQNFTANTAPEAGGPFRVEKTRSRTATLSGGQLFETMKDYTWTAYGEPATVIDYGYSDQGSDVAAGDNTVTTFEYAPNLADYIVDRPSRKYIQAGTVSSPQLSGWLSGEIYRYDGSTSNGVPPVEGNLTDYYVWNGAIQQLMRQLSYDDQGNVLTETDAKGAVTSHGYDPAKRLFRVSTTNALGQAVQTVWNTACQAPASQTDLNSLVTAFSYDVHCRETLRDFPNAQYLVTRYMNFGDAAQQYIETEEKSGSTASGSDKLIKRQYLDGLGQIRMTTTSGATSAISDAIAELRDYDARGNLEWTSIPLSWSAAQSGTTTTAERNISYGYDALNRPLMRTYADGAYDTTDYARQQINRFGVSQFVPATHSMDAQCYDASATTRCMQNWVLTDAAGRTIRSDLHDYGLTDVGETGSGRRTNYVYDLLGRLVQVTDPKGITFDYGYDFYGNRIAASDPGLGDWTMSYDLNGNLVSQTDASGQQITFTYDALNRVTLKGVGTGASRVETTYVYDEPRASFYNIGRLTTQAVTNPGAATVQHTILTDWRWDGQAHKIRHQTGGKTYQIQNKFDIAGHLTGLHLPATPGATAGGWTSTLTLDAAGRLTSWPGYITGVTYDLWSHPTRTDYANGSYDQASYSAMRGWLDAVSAYGSNAGQLFKASYTRSVSGRILAQDTRFVAGGAQDEAASYSYAYDYAGRLLSATNSYGLTQYDQSFTYDGAGRMRSNSQVGAYAYGNTGKAEHAPSTVTPGSGPAQNLVYDANGNMTQGLDGKVMTYDGENRPLTVSYAGRTTTYVYGADGARLKKIETDPVTGQNAVTLYMGPVEIRKWGQGTAEEILLYPAPNIRITKTNPGSGVVTKVNTLHADGLGSVRAVTDEAGLAAERSTYRPFGEEAAQTLSLTTPKETKGFIGERFDDTSGLQYLNARYYDPTLALFIQPDWWEVMTEGAGTNRYSYSANDPVNLVDTSGNVPYNPGGSTSTGWRENEDGTESYFGAGDRNSADYLKSPDIGGKTEITLGAWGEELPKDEYGSRSHFYTAPGRGAASLAHYDSRAAEATYGVVRNIAFAKMPVTAEDILQRSGGAAALPAVAFVGGGAKSTRLRHYTSKSGLNGIKAEQKIIAGDKNSVFATPARSKPMSQADAEKTLGITRGKGAQTVEFDAYPNEFTIRKNPLTKSKEYVIRGNVDLTGRNPRYGR